MEQSMARKSYGRTKTSRNWWCKLYPLLLLSGVMGMMHLTTASLGPRPHHPFVAKQLYEKHPSDKEVELGAPSSSQFAFEMRVHLSTLSQKPVKTCAVEHEEMGVDMHAEA